MRDGAAGHRGDLALRAHVDAAWQIDALLARATSDAQMHQDVPFEQVVDALGVPRSASHHPLFQVMAAYGERRALPPLGAPGNAVEVAVLPSGTPSAKFDLTLGVEATPSGTFDAAFVYALDLFDADAIARLAQRFVTLLDDALARPDVPVGDLDWLPEAERAQLFAWNASPDAGDDEPFIPVHARIAAHALARPDARGVADIDRALTRGEVDARAARLARQLVAAGVRPEMRVGVALQRSVDLLVALIAVLKSGAAFVPLDPAHPRERREQIVVDTIDALDDLAHVAPADVLPNHALMTDGETLTWTLVARLAALKPACPTEATVGALACDTASMAADARSRMADAGTRTARGISATRSGATSTGRSMPTAAPARAAESLVREEGTAAHRAASAASLRAYAWTSNAATLHLRSSSVSSSVSYRASAAIAVTSAHVSCSKSERNCCPRSLFARASCCSQAEKSACRRSTRQRRAFIRASGSMPSRRS
ncbi:hypothetical protein WJ69_04680 [Burkholderia ubonensis]|nr:hypothetical protein WJ69_04680 [Burkholderia ubonensis]